MTTENNVKNIVRFRHFHNKKNELVATMATQFVGEDKLAVAITRRNRTDKGTRAKGREVALARLERYKNAANLSESEQLLLDYDKNKQLLLECTHAELIALIKDNPFSRRNCKFGGR
jgi:hypothetical protein